MPRTPAQPNEPERREGATPATDATPSAAEGPVVTAAAEAPPTSPPAAPAATPTAGATTATQPSGTDPSATTGSRERREQYLIGKRPGAAPPGVQPLDFNVLSAALESNPNVDVVRRIAPPRVQSLSLLASGESTGQEILVVRMAEEDAGRLTQQAHAQLVVERDAPLSYSEPVAMEIGLRDPGVLTPSVDGFSVTITVTGKGGTRIEGATVYLFGSMWPFQGVTNAQGRVDLDIMGETPDTIRGLYVKPRSDYWSLWVPTPFLTAGRNNPVQLTPLDNMMPGFPGQQVFGWGQRAMHLDQLPPSLRGAGVKVAVVDSGAAITHQDLKDRIAGGFDITTGRDTTWKDDVIFHGSHCAGVIGGADNAHGIRGFAPEAGLYAYKVFPGGRFSDLIDALHHCMEDGVDVVNLSLGTEERSELLAQTIEDAKQQGIACIAAAGNSAGNVQFPAALQSVLAVAAIGKAGEFPRDSYHITTPWTADGAPAVTEGYFAAKFSCFGPEIDVCAPGVAIISCIPPDNFAAWDGTSMAAPHVTGLAALVLAHHPDFQGPFKARDARRVERLFQIIKDSAQRLNLGDRNREGVGMPDVIRALNVTPDTGAVPSGLSPEFWQQVLDALRRASPAQVAPATSRPGESPAAGTAVSALQSLDSALEKAGIRRGGRVAAPAIRPLATTNGTNGYRTQAGPGGELARLEKALADAGLAGGTRRASPQSTGAVTPATAATTPAAELRQLDEALATAGFRRR